VTFRTLTAEQINDYLSKMNPLDKAGAYAIQEHGDTIVSKISGSFSNVVGLPMEKLNEEIQAWGAGRPRRTESTGSFGAKRLRF
jgi:septum formation protein